MSNQPKGLIKQNLDRIFSQYEENEETQELYLEVQADIKEAILDSLATGMELKSAVGQAFLMIGDLEGPLSEISHKKQATERPDTQKEQADLTSEDSMGSLAVEPVVWESEAPEFAEVERRWLKKVERQTVVEQVIQVADWQNYQEIVIEQPTVEVAIFATEAPEMTVIESLTKSDSRYWGELVGKQNCLQYVSGERSLFSRGVKVFLTIYLPQAFAGSLTIANPNADLILAGLEALTTIEVKNASGTILGQHLGFENFFLDATSGSVKLTDLFGHALECTLSSGSLKISEAKLGEAQLKTNSGALQLTTSLIEDSKLITNSGSLKLKTVKMDQLSASTASGSLVLSDTLITNQWQLESKSGTVKFDCLYGAGTIQTTSGTIKGCLALSEQTELETTSGNIKVTIDEQYPVALYSQSATGNVKVKSLVAHRHSSASDQVALVIRTTNGNVMVL
ncbi:MAG: DUF4097 family beta strand repeat-containing protein [Enterococcus sp.]